MKRSKGKSSYHKYHQACKKSKWRYDLCGEMIGFLLTFNKKTSDAIREAYRILNNAEEKVYPEQIEVYVINNDEDENAGESVVDSNEVVASNKSGDGRGNDCDKDDNVDGMEEADDDDANEDVLKALTKPEESDTQALPNNARFQSANCLVDGYAFVSYEKKKGIADPHKLTQHIFRDVMETRKSICKTLMRFQPVQATCKLNKDEASHLRNFTAIFRKSWAEFVANQFRVTASSDDGDALTSEPIKRAADDDASEHKAEEEQESVEKVEDQSELPVDNKQENSQSICAEKSVADCNNIEKNDSPDKSERKDEQTKENDSGESTANPELDQPISSEPPTQQSQSKEESNNRHIKFYYVETKIRYVDYVKKDDIMAAIQTAINAVNNDEELRDLPRFQGKIPDKSSSSSEPTLSSGLSGSTTQTPPRDKDLIVVSINVLCNVATISFMADYFQFAKYNLAELSKIAISTN